MKILKSDNRLLFLKNRAKFIIPIAAKIRLEATREFGASSLIRLLNNGCDYMIINK
jgi:hypothetical protein